MYFYFLSVLLEPDSFFGFRGKAKLLARENYLSCCGSKQAGNCVVPS